MSGEMTPLEVEIEQAIRQPDAVEQFAQLVANKVWDRLKADQPTHARDIALRTFVELEKYKRMTQDALVSSLLDFFREKGVRLYWHSTGCVMPRLPDGADDVLRVLVDSMLATYRQPIEAVLRALHPPAERTQLKIVK